MTLALVKQLPVAAGCHRDMGMMPPAGRVVQQLAPTATKQYLVFRREPQRKIKIKITRYSNT